MGETELRVDDTTHRTLWIGVLWLLFTLALGDLALSPDTLLSGLVGALVIGAGVYANSRCRAFRPRRSRGQLSLTALSLGVGIVAGAIVLGAELGLAVFDSGLRAGFARFSSEPWSETLNRAFEAAVIEEVIVRYVGMTLIVLIAMRRVAEPQRAYRIALVAQAVIFGFLHSEPSLVGLAVMVLMIGAGYLLGWIYWNWGLAHAMLCHLAAGVVIQSLAPRLVS